MILWRTVVIGALWMGAVAASGSVEAQSTKGSCSPITTSGGTSTVTVACFIYNNTTPEGPIGWRPSPGQASQRIWPPGTISDGEHARGQTKWGVIHCIGGNNMAGGTGSRGRKCYWE